MSLQESVLTGLKRVGAAVSGGADSVFLLHALAERGLASGVLHVNHKLRGEESERDEAFVRSLAHEMGLPVVCIAAPPAEGNIEQEARRARYSFFEAQIAAGFCDAVATGHTRDDQAETVLIRFLRGAATAGLSGIRPRTAGGIVRPLLGLRRDEIRSSLRARGIVWREDASNRDPVFLRNRLRQEIMPQLEALNPSLVDVLASASEWARGEEDYWDAELARFEAMCIRKTEAILIRTGDLTGLSVAARRRLIRRLVERVRGSLRSIDFRHGEAILALAAQTEGSGRMQLPDLDIYRSFDWLRIAPAGIDSRLDRNFEIPLPIPGLVEVPERDIALEVKPLLCNKHVYNEDVYLLDRDKCGDSLVLRNWQPGDRLRPTGPAVEPSAEEPKMKTLFQQSRIPLWERRNWPVIADDRGTVVWTRRFGAAARFAATSGTERILIVRESKPSGAASIVSEGHPAVSGFSKEAL